MPKTAKLHATVTLNGISCILKYDKMLDFLSGVLKLGKKSMFGLSCRLELYFYLLAFGEYFDQSSFVCALHGIPWVVQMMEGGVESQVHDVGSAACSRLTQKRLFS